MLPALSIAADAETTDCSFYVHGLVWPLSCHCSDGMRKIGPGRGVSPVIACQFTPTSFVLMQSRTASYCSDMK